MSRRQDDGTLEEGRSLALKNYTHNHLQWRKLGACPSLSLLDCNSLEQCILCTILTGFFHFKL